MDPSEERQPQSADSQSDAGDEAADDGSFIDLEDYLSGESGEDDGQDAETSGDDAPGDDDEAEEEEDLDHIRERARLADQYEQWAAQQQQQQARQNAEAQWAAQARNANQYFDARAASVWQQSSSAPDPIAYARNEISKITREREVWHQKFADSQKQELWRFAESMAVPQYAAVLADQYGLSAAAAEQLATYPVEIMEREALRMKRERSVNTTLKKKATQAQSSAKAQKLSSLAGPGNGRAPVGKVKKGSREHLYAAWSRGAATE